MDTKKDVKIGQNSGLKLFGVVAGIIILGVMIKQFISVNISGNTKTDFSLTNNLTEKEFKEKAISVEYGDLLRTPQNYTGKILSVKCEVFQKGKSFLMVQSKAFSDTLNYFGDNIYVDYDGDNIIDGDIIHIYGEFEELLTYETALHIQQTVPRMRAKYIEMIKRR